MKKNGEIELTALLEVQHSKIQVNIIADLVDKKPVLFKSLVNLSIKTRPLIPQRASWVLNEVVHRHANWIETYVEILSEKLLELEHNGTQRNIAKILARSPLPKQNLGLLLNTCFYLVESAETAIAVRAHCMTILYRISEIEPDIEGELKDVLSGFVQTGSAGEAARAKRILKKMNN